jgi:hypothetical protein
LFHVEHQSACGILVRTFHVEHAQRSYDADIYVPRETDLRSQR